MKNPSGSLVLSGVNTNQMVMDNNRSLATWGPRERPDMMSNIGASGALPTWVPEPVKEFLTEPAPSSTGAMVGVTVAGAGISHLLGKYGNVEPGVRALLGAGLLLGSHYGLERWEGKSLGYGALFEGLAGMVQKHLESRGSAQPGQPGAVPAGPGASNVLEESEFLEIVERDTRALPAPVTASAGLRRPSGTVWTPEDAEKFERSRAFNAFFDRAIALFGPQREPIDGNQPVRLGTGEVITVTEYMRRFPMQIEERRARGSQARSRRARPADPYQEEWDYLQWEMDLCRQATRGLVAAQEPARRAWDIRLVDGTFRSYADYTRDMGWKTRLVALMCDRDERAGAPDRRAVLENARGSGPSAPPAGGSSTTGTSTGESMQDRLLGRTPPAQPGGTGAPGELFTMTGGGRDMKQALPRLASETTTSSLTPEAIRSQINPNLLVNQTMTGSAGLKHRKTR